MIMLPRSTLTSLYKMRSILFVFYISLAFGLPSPRDAEKCDLTKCKIDQNCRCSSVDSPLANGEAPQLIVLSFDEAVVSNVYEEFWYPLLNGRTNPDNNPISGTFYVPHEYTDYARVQTLWKNGFEIGVNSITKNGLQSYWKDATLQTLKDEFGGQRTIISTFANIPKEDIKGARTPMLQLNGDVSIQAYAESEIAYDNSWATLSSDLLFPYTLDYKSTQSCTQGNVCPVNAHAGFWIAPITNLVGYDNVECNSLVTCNENGTAQEISTWLLGEIDKFRSGKKAPITLLVSSAWFQYNEHSYDGFVRTLDALKSYNDVFLVSQSQVLDWIKKPVPLSEFKTEVTANRNATCTPTSCRLTNEEDSERYMTSCVPCPEVYPWLGNPLGKAKTTTQATTVTTQPPTTKVTTQPPTTKVTTEPPTTKVTTEPPTTKVTTQPPTTKVTTEPPTTKVTTQPPTTKVTTEPPTTKVTTQPPTTKVTTEPPTTKVTTHPPTTKVTTHPPTTKETTPAPTIQKSET